MSLEIFESRHITEFNKNAHLEAGDVTKRVPAHLLLLIFSILKPLREILHFFPFLPPPHISRRLHSSRPDVHLLQPWISKKLGWLAYLYSMFYTLALSIWHTGECSVPRIWFTMTLLLVWERETMSTLWDFLSLSLFMCFPQREAPHILEEYKANDCYCLALFNRKYTIRVLCSIWCLH